MGDPRTQRIEGDADDTRVGFTMDRSVRWTLFALALFAIMLVGSNVFIHVLRFGFGYEDLVVPTALDLDREATLASSFSALILALAAWLAFRLGSVSWPFRRNESTFWFAMAAALFLGAVDEAAEIHGYLMAPVRRAVRFTGIPFPAWAILTIIVLVILAMIFLRFTLRLDGRLRFLFVLAAVLYVGGAFGMEIVSSYFFITDGHDSLTYITSATIEESAEIAGILLLIYALFAQLGLSAAADAHRPPATTDRSTHVP